MNILVYGAGVLGSLYAAFLQDSGQCVSLLARGDRLKYLREHALVVKDSRSGFQLAVNVDVIDNLEPQAAFDFVVVLVRKNQLASVLPALAENHQTPNVLFMVNSAAGPDELVKRLGRERVLLGFPGAGGERCDVCVRYNILPGWFQATTFGELDGGVTPRLKQITRAFRIAGFPTAISTNMPAWLKTHVAVVSPIANALYMAGGDIHRLAGWRRGVTLMVRAIREGFQVLRAAGVPITPSKFNFVTWLPERQLVAVMQRLLNTSWAELVIERHAITARSEMEQLAYEFRTLSQSTGIPAPCLDRLYGYLLMEKGI